MLQPVGTARGITESMPTGDKTTARLRALMRPAIRPRPASGEMWGDLFLARLSPETKSGLSPAQLEEIKRVARSGRARPPSRRLALQPAGCRSAGNVSTACCWPAPTGAAARRHAQDRMMRRQPRRRPGRSNVQALAVGFRAGGAGADAAGGDSSMPTKPRAGMVGIEGDDNRTPIETEDLAMDRARPDQPRDRRPLHRRADRARPGADRGALPLQFQGRALDHPDGSAFRRRLSARRLSRACRGPHDFTVSPDWDPTAPRTNPNIGNDWALMRAGAQPDRSSRSRSAAARSQQMKPAAGRRRADHRRL